ncbi:hypothetical protein [Sulfuricurvum sp.]|uniref:hypothetical protein n=1 Tax=Sulfuricurvum sp. TaxID=2025608 RepID=UPI0035699858
MVQCSNKSERCFVVTDRFKEPCQHAVPHEFSVHCVGGRCVRFEHFEEDRNGKQVWVGTEYGTCVKI